MTATQAELEVDVVLGSYDSFLIGYSLDLLKCDAELFLKSKFQEKSHMGSIRSVAASPCGILASGGADEIIKLFSIRDRTEVGSLLQHEGTINCLEFYKDQYLFSSSDDGSICLWDCHNWECTHQLTGHKGPVYSCAVHPKGTVALSVGKDKTLRTWDVIEGKCAFIRRLPEVANIVLWSPVGDSYVVVTDKSFAVYDVESGRVAVDIAVGHHINCIVFVQNHTVAVGSESLDIHFYSTVTGTLLATLKGHTNRIKSLSLLSGPELLFSASSDGLIKVWKLSVDDIASSNCICQTTTASRLTCMTLVCPVEHLHKKGKVKKVESSPAVASAIKKHKRKKKSKLKNVDKCCVTVEYEVEENDMPLSKKSKLVPEVSVGKNCQKNLKSKSKLLKKFL